MHACNVKSCPQQNSCKFYPIRGIVSYQKCGMLQYFSIVQSSIWLTRFVLERSPHGSQMPNVNVVISLHKSHFSRNLASNSMNLELRGRTKLDRISVHVPLFTPAFVYVLLYRPQSRAVWDMCISVSFGQRKKKPEHCGLHIYLFEIKIKFISLEHPGYIESAYPGAQHHRPGEYNHHFSASCPSNLHRCLRH